MEVGLGDMEKRPVEYWCVKAVLGSPTLAVSGRDPIPVRPP